MEGITHRTVAVNGINMHIAEKGEGPVVLFIHGFPELWYSWRHQMVALAARGYRAIAPDLRGYGDTDAPPCTTDYTIFHLVGDLVALLDALAQDQVTVDPPFLSLSITLLFLLIVTNLRDIAHMEIRKVFVVGHDWGAMVAWWLCMLRPDRVRALVNLSVAFSPRNPARRPVDSLKAIFGDDHYICRFQVYICVYFSLIFLLN